MNKTNLTVDGTKLTLERVFPASPERVWSAWSTGEAFSRWWGPRGWNTTVKDYSFEPGGTLHYGMKCEDPAQGDWYGQVSWGKMVMKDVTPLTFFSYTDYFCDEAGTIDENLPSTFTENTLEPVEGGTKFTSVAHYATEADLKTVLDMGMEAGISQTWDRLEELVSTN